MTGSSAPGDWRPAAALSELRRRARMLASMRAFFAERGVLEVETPILSRAATTDPHLESFVTRFVGPGAAQGQTAYLHTSPEFAMKRLLAAGSGPIYQICRVFRQGEAGRRHNPEFTLLEWYRPGFDHHRLMDEVQALVEFVLDGQVVLEPAERISYREAFLRWARIDPFAAPVAALREHAAAAGIGPVPGLEEADRDGWLDLLLTHLVEPRLGERRLTFVYDYPASQAALARLRPGEPAVGERFELYLHGVELANGFHELGDAAEQRARFSADLERRAAAGLPAVPMDERLLEALEVGLPDCAGVALGVDRLLMLAAGASSLEQVLAFPWQRA